MAHLITFDFDNKCIVTSSQTRLNNMYLKLIKVNAVFYLFILTYFWIIMYRWNKNRTAIVLIFSSLLLLLFFLINWVHIAYANEKENMQKEISYTFKDITRTLEDSLLHQVLLINTSFSGDPMSSIRSITKTEMHLEDSISMVLAIDGDIHKSGKMDSSMQMIIQTSNGPDDLPENLSLLPLLMSWQKQSSNMALTLKESSDSLVKIIGARFQNYIVKSDLPKSYKIIETAGNESTEDIIVEFYRLPHIDTAYAAIFSNYFWSIIKKIRQTILFSFILFAAISVSFYMIYSNWRKQQKLIDIKNDFISNVTHELQTPISTVNVALEALSQFDVIEDKTKTAEYLQISRKELNRLKILVDRVLKMAIFEKGATQFHFEKLSFDQVLNDVIDSMKIQFEKVNADVQVDMRGADFSIDGDKIHLTNVIYNLLDNAIKYCRETPEIKIRLAEQKSTIDLFIEDYGIGIAKDEQKKVFNQFYRVLSGDKHDVKGHGLGLSYVAYVINRHKGNLDLESTPMKGSTFHVRLNKCDEGN